MCSEKEGKKLLNGKSKIKNFSNNNNNNDYYKEEEKEEDDDNDDDDDHNDDNNNKNRSKWLHSWHSNIVFDNSSWTTSKNTKPEKGTP